MLMVSGIGQDCPGSFPDAIKDPPSACGVRVRKIRGFESPVVGR